MLGRNLDKLVHPLAYPQHSNHGEQGKAGEALVAEELDEELVFGCTGFNDDSFQQLHVVLDGVLALLVDAEALEEPLVHDGLREDVDQVVGLAAVGDKEVEKLEDGLRGQAFGGGGEDAVEDGMLTEAAACTYRYMKNSSEDFLCCT